MEAPGRYYVCVPGGRPRPVAAVAVPRKSGKGVDVAGVPVGVGRLGGRRIGVARPRRLPEG